MPARTLKLRAGAILALIAALGLAAPRLTGAPLPSREAAVHSPAPARDGGAADALKGANPEAFAAALWGGQERSPLAGDRAAAIFVTLVILGCVIGAVQMSR